MRIITRTEMKTRARARRFIKKDSTRTRYRSRLETLSVLPRCFILDGIHGSHHPPGQAVLAGKEVEIEGEEKNSSASPQADDSSWLSPRRWSEEIPRRSEVVRCEAGEPLLCFGWSLAATPWSWRSFPAAVTERDGPGVCWRRAGISPALLWGDGGRLRKSDDRGGDELPCSLHGQLESRDNGARRREESPGRGLWFERLLEIMDQGFMN
ncbi:hypothetical protein EDB81DRAFT_390515 [Dactylonectria macrodidyma]|uniref:Uncharacterized protein n=1 Tax=Dactylonectria macrodidyma TaxID=307937 RepID=A0A9P9F9T2_9HYPO|nr:hypothetical protein EDB81DRAFT_390515 [Dactylonectria macrodidyma]